jgi:membrane protein DedA with SNARE-associated domain
MLDWISQYGYIGLFAALMFGIAGLPIPDETILVFCGYLIAIGRMTWAGALATGIAGSICGITLSYLIGRSAGYALIHRYGRYVHITERRLEGVHTWFRRLGHWLLTFGYFILGVRHLTALVAGSSRLEFGVFARFAYTGAVLWVASFLGIGYLVGDKWPAALDSVRRYSWGLVGAGLVAGAAYLAVRRLRASRLQE